MNLKREYFSKWRRVWIEFRAPPTPGQLAELKKYGYQIRQVPA